MLEKRHFGVIRTFAILLGPSLGLDVGEHLGENHRMLAIPA